MPMACPAPSTPEPQPRAPLTTPRREALCKVFLVSTCVLECVNGTVPRMLLHALTPCFLIALSQSQVRGDAQCDSHWVSPWLCKGCHQCAASGSAYCFVTSWIAALVVSASSSGEWHLVSTVTCFPVDSHSLRSVSSPRTLVVMKSLLA